MAEQPFLTQYLNSRNYDSIKNGEQLKDQDVANARECLKKDRDASVLNSLLTFASAISSINKNNYSWAFIQCYYTIFYLAKALLALKKDIGVYYIKSDPYIIKTSFGETFKKKQRKNTHEDVLTLYKEHFDGNSLLNGDIDNTPIIDWFKHNRNMFNYKKNPMTDPTPPDPLFKYNDDLRNWLSCYRNEYLYCFNSQHAYIAFPMKLIDHVISFYKDHNQKNIFITDDNIKHISSNCSDKKGFYNFLINDLKEIKP